MYSVNGNPLLEDELSVITELQRQVTLNGKDVMRHIKRSGTNIMFTCPFHKDGMERKPSFGVSDNMECHCFTCGWSGELDEFISALFGYEDGGSFGRRWLSKNFVSLEVETRKPLPLNMSRNKPADVSKAPGFTEEELDSYRYYHPYMYKRGLTNEIIEKFDVGYDNDSKCLTFPVYDVDKSPCFIARRSVEGKFFSYPTGVQKPVYGAERIMEGVYRECVICESIFNCLTCWKFNIPAVALLGTGDTHQYEILKQLPVRKYILALDPDDAGRRGREKLRHYLGKTKLITEWVVPEGYDLNDLDSKILELKEVM